MDEGVCTFRLATMGRRGKVVFSAEGMDILRAWLIRHIEECARSEDRAKANPNPTNPEWSRAQATYYRNARAYLTHLLCSRVHPSVNLNTELAVLTRWHDEYTVPPGWAEAVQLAASMGDDDAISGPTAGGGGAGGGRGVGAEAVAAGRERPVPAPAAHGAGPDDDPRPGGEQAGATARKGRGRATRPDH